MGFIGAAALAATLFEVPATWAQGQGLQTPGQSAVVVADPVLMPFVHGLVGKTGGDDNDHFASVEAVQQIGWNSGLAVKSDPFRVMRIDGGPRGLIGKPSAPIFYKSTGSIWKYLAASDAGWESSNNDFIGHVVSRLLPKIVINKVEGCLSWGAPDISDKLDTDDTNNCSLREGRLSFLLRRLGAGLISLPFGLIGEFGDLPHGILDLAGIKGVFESEARNYQAAEADKKSQPFIDRQTRKKMRPHWLAKDDVLSVEISGRKAGAFNFAYSANATTGGEDAGIRLLYGSGFRLLHHYAFIDIEAGERWLSHPRPSQTAFDLTAGLWLAPRWMVMLQSFNLVSGPARAPYVYYRTHKLEASAVWRMTRRLSLQGGVFFSPAGQNALDERGLCLSLWADL